MNSNNDDSLFNDDQSLFDGEDENELALQSSSGSARIAREDIRLMNVVRAIVILSLLTFAVISAETVFIMSLIAEENSFKDAFNDASQVLTNAMYERVSTKIWIAKTFAHDLAMDAKNSDLVWPHMTFDHFTDRCKGPLHLSESSTITFAPFVDKTERASWEEIAVLTYPLIDNESLFPSIDRNAESETSSTDEVMYHVTGRTIDQGIYRFVNEVAQDHEFSNEGYFPIWQQAPPPPTVENNPETLIGTMFNLVSVEARVSGLQTMLQREAASISQFLFEGSAGQDYAVFSAPHSAIYSPIYGVSNSSGTSALDTVGTVEFEFKWDHIFAGVLSGLDDLPLFAVVENTCDNRQFTYVVQGEAVVFEGQGDLHSTDVDGYDDFSSNPEDFDALFLEHTKNTDVETESCSYFVSYFPTGTFKKHYVTNRPEAYRGIVLGIFLFILFIFWTYDSLIERRQVKVIDAAAKSDAIVRSLFPSNIRDRLYEQSQAQKAVKSDGKEAWRNPDASLKNGGIIETPKNRLKSFISKSPEDQAVQANHIPNKGAVQSEPIADLFPQTTIMFADISGFTAWSSEREPSQVFTLLESIYRQMDRAAKKLGVFKVETVGDCYVAATGIPDPQPSFGAEIMVRFARTCLIRMNILTKELEAQLGPGTAELTLRIGIHSGPVTAGVLRGQKARFQLFGDTMNTASRMESTGQRNKIQLSGDTAEILIKNGKSDWVTKRNDLVQVKGKGAMQTYWLLLKTSSQSHASMTDGSEVAFSLEEKKKKPSRAVGQKKREIWAGTDLEGVLGVTEIDEDIQRLVNWNVDVLLLLLKRVVTARIVNGVENKKISGDIEKMFSSNKLVLDDFQLVINMPEFDAEVASRTYNEDVELVPEVRKELHDYIISIASGYRRNSFHNFEHASHVILSANKLLKRVMAADDCKPLDNALTCRELYNHTYGIGTDPLTQFAVVFSALVHDVGHEGVPNGVLGKMHPLLAEKYSGKAIAEQRSVDIAWDLLALPQFSHLRSSIYQSKTEYKRFRSLVVNGVMATDIFDKDLKELRDTRWETAFQTTERDSQVLKESMDRKATIVIEHIIQASDVAHTMQHFFIYSKWNERLFKEMYFGYLSGCLEKNPTEGWYEGEIWFFNNYVIPLARKLKECAVFGVSSDEYLNYALQNLNEWERKGRTLCDVMKKKANKEAREIGLLVGNVEADEEGPEIDHPDIDLDSVEFGSLGDSSIDTSFGTSTGSDFQDIPQEVRDSIENRIAEEVRMALEDSALPDPRVREVTDDGSRAFSVRSVKVPAGKIGIVIDTSDEGPVVHEVHVSSPVKGRIYPGDRITAVNGTSTHGMSQENLAILMASLKDNEREFQIESL